AALGELVRPESRGHWDLGQRRRERLRLGAAELLARREQDEPLVRNEGRVEDVNGVGIPVERRGEDDLRSCFREQRAERLVLARDRGGIRLGPPAVLAPALETARPPQQHAAKSA